MCHVTSGTVGVSTLTPSRYIRFIFNRVILENAVVRAAAVSTLGKPTACMYICIYICVCVCVCVCAFCPLNREYTPFFTFHSSPSSFGVTLLSVLVFLHVSLLFLLPLTHYLTLVISHSLTTSSSTRSQEHSLPVCLTCAPPSSSSCRNHWLTKTMRYGLNRTTKHLSFYSITALFLIQLPFIPLLCLL
jgi:hypothetical protein